VLIAFGIEQLSLTRNVNNRCGARSHVLQHFLRDGAATLRAQTPDLPTGFPAVCAQGEVIANLTGVVMVPSSNGIAC
jgi:hypothetical protein